jgi:hypothetical protein
MIAARPFSEAQYVVIVTQLDEAMGWPPTPRRILRECDAARHASYP